MAISFACEQCRKAFTVDDAHAGKRIKCKACGASMTIPGAAKRSAPARPSADEVDDPFGLGDASPSDLAESDTEPGEVLARGARGGRRPGTAAPSAGVPGWAWLAGGGVGLLLVVVLAAVMLSRPGAAPPAVVTQPGTQGEVPVLDPTPPEPPSPADLARFKRDDSPADPKNKKAAPGPVEAGNAAWQVKPDPAPEPVEFPPVAKLSITVPQSFSGRIHYPTTPSPFVVVGGNDVEEQSREVWDLRTAKRVGRLAGKVEGGKPIALSADGAYLVVHTSPVPRSTDVWRIADAKRVAQIMDDKNIPDVIDFAGPGPNRIVIGTSYAQVLQVWDFVEGKPVATLKTPSRFQTHSLAFSPGRRFMALAIASKNRLQIFDLAAGRLAGEIAMVKVDSPNYDCEGLAFSPDGTALAGLFTLSNTTHLMCWDATNGQLVSDFASPGHNPYGKSFSYDAQVVQWLPDQSGWLIQDQTFVERQSGQVVWSMPFPPIKYIEHGPRKVLDLGRVVSVAAVNNRQVLRIATLPADKIRVAIALAKGGKNAIDAILPPIKPTDLTGAARVAPTAGPVAWTTGPGPSPASKAPSGKSIPVKVTAGDVLGLVVSSPDASQALVFSSPGGRLSGVKGKQSQEPRQVGRYDLVAGRPLDNFEILSISRPIAFSPGASRFLMAQEGGLDRLDLHDANGGKHLVGWRPYEQEPGDDRIVVWADFLDPNRVLTVNRIGTLVLWSVPDCKAVYVATQAMQGLPALSPNRKSLAVLHNGTLRLIDPSTGKPQGDATSSGHRGLLGLIAAGFSPDGQEFAAVLDGQIVRWDLKTGQIVGEVVAPNPKATSLQYGDAHHVLLDGKILFDLTSKRPVWSYDGGVHAAGGNGSVHRFVASDKIIGPGTLRTVDVPDKNAARAEAGLADPKTKALLRDGLKVSIQIVGEPARDADKFRRGLVDGLTGQLQQVGVEVADGQPVKVVVKFNVKDTGRNIEFRKFTGKPGEPEKRVIQARLLNWELAVTDDKGAPIAIARDSVAFTSPGFFENIPNDETDWEGYLKARQFFIAAKAILKYGVPYYVARRPDGGVFLPGRTFLGHPTL